MNQNRKILFILPIVILLSIFVLWWANMVITDYELSKKALPPKYAQNTHSYDIDKYRGLGYTIIISTGYPVSPPGVELKGYFYWGEH